MWFDVPCPTFHVPYWQSGLLRVGQPDADPAHRHPAARRLLVGERRAGVHLDRGQLLRFALQRRRRRHRPRDQGGPHRRRRH